MYKLYHDAYDNLKISLTHPFPMFRNYSDFGIIWEAISGNYPRGIGAQFASKDSYFEQNIKQVLRSNWGVIKHPWKLYLIYIIIHVPFEKNLEHLGQFGGLDIKTS